MNARLRWDPIEYSVSGCPIDITAYLVFYSPTFEGPYYYHGYTSDTTYAHLGVVQFAGGQFYEVTAYTGAIGLLNRVPPQATHEQVMRLLGRGK